MLNPYHAILGATFLAFIPVPMRVALLAGASGGLFKCVSLPRPRPPRERRPMVALERRASPPLSCPSCSPAAVQARAGGVSPARALPACAAQVQQCDAARGAGRAQEQGQTDREPGRAGAAPHGRTGALAPRSSGPRPAAAGRCRLCRLCRWPTAWPSRWAVGDCVWRVRAARRSA